MNQHEVRKTAERERILAALRAAENGLTGTELYQQTRIGTGALAARLLELEGAGLVTVERPARPRGEHFRYHARNDGDHE
jgi:DNA-binding transcriptional ArsR family regulator